MRRAHGGRLSDRVVHSDARTVADDVIRRGRDALEGRKIAHLRPDLLQALKIAAVGEYLCAALGELADTAPARAARTEHEHALARDVHARIVQHEHKPESVRVVPRARCRHHGVDGGKRLCVPLCPRKKREDLRLERNGHVECVEAGKERPDIGRKARGRNAHAFVGTALAHLPEQKPMHDGAQRSGDVLSITASLSIISSRCARVRARIPPPPVQAGDIRPLPRER